jgi:hypothetical protein
MKTKFILSTATVSDSSTSFNYMRDLQVHLPVTVSKAAFLIDLECFGFDTAALDDQGGKSTIRQGSLVEATKAFATVAANVKAGLHQLDEWISASNKKIERWENLKGAIATAQVLFLSMMETDGTHQRHTIELSRGEHRTEQKKRITATPEELWR